MTADHVDIMRWCYLLAVMTEQISFNPQGALEGCGVNRAAANRKRHLNPKAQIDGLYETNPQAKVDSLHEDQPSSCT